jgi:hypothetical protein
MANRDEAKDVALWKGLEPATLQSSGFDGGPFTVWSWRDELADDWNRYVPHADLVASEERAVNAEQEREALRASERLQNENWHRAERRCDELKRELVELKALARNVFLAREGNEHEANLCWKFILALGSLEKAIES